MTDHPAPSGGRLPVAVEAHLDQHREMMLFCRGEDARPIGYPMMIFGRTQTEIFFSTYRKSAKVRHLERDPRVALLSLTPMSPTSVRWVGLAGRVVLWQPTAEELDRLMPASTGESRVPSGVRDLVYQRTLEGKRILLRVMLDAPERASIEEAAR